LVLANTGVVGVEMEDDDDDELNDSRLLVLVLVQVLVLAVWRFCNPAKNRKEFVIEFLSIQGNNNDDDDDDEDVKKLVATDGDDAIATNAVVTDTNK
jgi:hypothetical protein